MDSSTLRLGPTPLTLFPKSVVFGMKLRLESVRRRSVLMRTEKKDLLVDSFVTGLYILTGGVSPGVVVGSEVSVISNVKLRTG